MSYVDPQTYSSPSLPVQGFDTADSVASSYAKRAQPSECSLVSIVSQSGDQSSGGQIMINLGNTPNTFIKNGSVYLRLQLSMRSLAATVARGRVLSSSPTGSWASLIKQITVSCGSNVIEQINNYWIHHEAILLHASSGPYFQQDMKLLECGLNSVDAATGATVFNWANGDGISTRSAILTIPLFLGSINNPQENKNFPLGLLTGGVQVQIDLQSFGQAAVVTGAPDGAAADPTNNVSEYTVSNAALSYEAIKVSSEYMNALRGSLAQQGQLFQMPFVSTLCMNVASSATLDVVYGLGLNSMKSVLYTQKPTAAGLKLAKYNAGRVLRVYADGKLQNNYNVADLTTSYAELNRALGNLASRSSTSGPSDMITKYHSDYYYGGCAFNKFSDSSLAMTGTACQQLQFHLESTPSAGDSTFILVFYDAVLSASPMSGECSVLR